MKLCKDCKHIQKYAYTDANCMRPVSGREPVWGNKVRKGIRCTSERVDGQGRCGTKGKFWEKKTSFWDKLRGVE